MEKCGIGIVCIGDAEEAGGFLGTAADRGLAQQAFDGDFGNFPQGLGAATGNRDGCVARRQAEGVAELGGGDEEFRHLSVVRSADEHFPLVRLEGDVKDGVGKRGIGGMTVCFPIGTAGIDFDVTGESRAIDLDGGVGEIGSGAVVPLAELGDAERASVLEFEIPTECAGKPERLEFEFGWEFWRSNFLESQRGVPDAL